MFSSLNENSLLDKRNFDFLINTEFFTEKFNPGIKRVKLNDFNVDEGYEYTQNQICIPSLKNPNLGDLFLTKNASESVLNLDLLNQTQNQLNPVKDLNFLNELFIELLDYIQMHEQTKFKMEFKKEHKEYYQILTDLLNCYFPKKKQKKKIDSVIQIDLKNNEMIFNFDNFHKSKDQIRKYFFSLFFDGYCLNKNNKKIYYELENYVHNMQNQNLKKRFSKNIKKYMFYIFSHKTVGDESFKNIFEPYLTKTEDNKKNQIQYPEFQAKICQALLDNREFKQMFKNILENDSLKIYNNSNKFRGHLINKIFHDFQNNYILNQQKDDITLFDYSKKYFSINQSKQKRHNPISFFIKIKNQFLLNLNKKNHGILKSKR